MHRGYVKKWRKIVDSKFFSMGLKHIGLFDYLLIKANWKTGWFMGHKIEPGQFGTSITKLADAVGEHRHTVKKILQDLSDCSMIERQNMSNRWVLITVCNWETYQGNGADDNPTGLQPDSNRTPTACHENATIKEGKALKNENKKKYIPDFPYGSEEFLEAWNGLMEVRKAKKAPYTKRAIDGVLKKLNSLANSEAAAIRFLDNATQSGWVTVWPERSFGNSNKPDPEIANEKRKIKAEADGLRMAEVLKRRGVRTPNMRLEQQ